MKRRFVMPLLVAAAVSPIAHGQTGRTSEPRLHLRQGPSTQAPDEQLLPPSSVSTIEHQNHRDYPQKYSVVYMAVSLASERVRTPEFSGGRRAAWYDIVIQIEKALPLKQMQCMTGTTSGPLDERLCEKADPLLRADWTLWEDGRMVQWGSIPDRCGCIFTAKNIFKLVGSFPLESGKKYVVQVHFTKDGTPLNVAKPHLIVIAHKDMW
ncbi:MAG TPA: hypothetical protein VGE93_18365 [Bryobacteraceae bacterium]